MATRLEDVANANETIGVLEILAPDGSLARYSGTSKINLTQDLEERWIELGGEGKVVLTEISPGTISDTIELSGGYRIRIRYEPPLHPGSHIFKTVYEFRNSFLGKDEFYTLIAPYPTRRLEFTVKFPQGIVVESASAVRFDRGAKLTTKEVAETLPSLTFEEKSWYQIRWSKENPRLHSEYRVKWAWRPFTSQ